MHITVGTPLLSRPQQTLYGRLVRAFPGHVILAQVSLTRHWVADFVVCRADFTALAVVEFERLDDPCASQCLEDAQVQAASIKIVRLCTDDIPAEAALKALIAALPANGSTVRLRRRASSTTPADAAV